MKDISIRELHRRTGTWVRDVRKYGAILVRDRGTPVATLIPAAGEPLVNAFEHWKPLRKFAAALEQPVGGRRVEEIISEDRGR